MPEGGDAKTPRDERGVIEAIADLLQTIVDWLRQEAEAAVRDKIVFPLQKLGFTLFWAWAAASVAVLGIGFIAVGALILLSEWLTWPGALFAVGGALVLGAAIFTALKMRSMER
ncbi:MAG: hypothetical protein OEV43_04980 [Coriobacteriia bacterium]|nr:hypothetical protein [Coriobacteriia bacterium]